MLSLPLTPMALEQGPNDPVIFWIPAPFSCGVVGAPHGEKHLLYILHSCARSKTMSTLVILAFSTLFSLLYFPQPET